MKPIIEFEECLRDTPKFRSCLEDAEDDIEQLDQRLDKVVKLCNSMVEAGKVYMTTNSAFIGGIVDLSAYFRNDPQVTVNSALNKLVQALNEMLKYQSILIDQAHRSICKNLNDFVKNDVRSVKETKRYFEKISDDYDMVLIRNSQTPRSKPHECEDAHNNLTAIRSCFQHTSLDYVHQITVLQAKKRYEVLDKLLSFMLAQSTYFHQGSDLLQDLEPMMKDLSTTITKMRDDTNSLEKKMESRHKLVTQKDILPTNSSSSISVELDGYLFKRTSNAFKTWNRFHCRRWFMIKNNQLVYRKRNKDDSLTVMEEDLRLCSVKPAHEVDRRFCFEVLSPAKSHMLQADSEEMYNLWLTTLQQGINAAIQQIMHEDDPPPIENSSKTKDLLPNQEDTHESSPNLETTRKPETSRPSASAQILSLPGNEKCCDCRSPQACWASINLGITLCIECSGIHRSLGVHYSKVRSLTLDAWESELVKIMKELGNEHMNRIYEANVNENIAVRAFPNCPRPIREAWIKAKYIQKAFVKRVLDGKPLRTHLRRQTNVRKPSLRPRPHSHPASDNGSASSASSQSNTPTVVLRDESRNSVMTDVEFQRKRSAVVFEGLGDFKLTLVNDDSSDEKIDELNRLDPAVASAVAAATLDGTLQPNNVAEDSADSDSNYMSCSDNQADDDTIELDKDQSDGASLSVETPEDVDLSDVDEDDNLNPNELLQKAARECNIPLMSEALATGADMNWMNENDEGKTAVHQAIMSNSVIACEYLFLNGAKTNVRDGLGRTPLHLATELGNTGQVCLLLKRGADQHALDNRGLNSLAVAVALTNANADIVTLLRLAKLNDEMKESEFGNHDETFNEVVKDFSKLASDNPEKLRRAVLQETNKTPP